MSRADREPTLTTLATRINQHLTQLEAHRVHNARNARGTPRYYGAQAHVAGRYLGIRYVDYQLTYYLSRANALAYCTWLDEGHRGRHHDMPGAR